MATQVRNPGKHPKDSSTSRVSIFVRLTRIVSFEIHAVGRSCSPKRNLYGEPHAQCGVPEPTADVEGPPLYASLLTTIETCLYAHSPIHTVNLQNHPFTVFLTWSLLRNTRALGTKPRFIQMIKTSELPLQGRRPVDDNGE